MDPLARNIEVKARCNDLQRAAHACQAMGAVEAGILAQTDTYFRVPQDRLKLRETANAPAELIWYSRSDEARPRQSDYLRVPVDRPELLKQALSRSVGILIVVAKSRRLLKYRNVRIHLDEVAGLGQFVEFEAVISPGESEAAAYATVRALCDAIGVADGDLERGSYADLLLKR